MNEHTINTLQETDIKMFNYLKMEHHRQASCLQMIASENMASSAVMQLQGSVFTNKYAEGYPGKRYYQGCNIYDKIEQLATDRLCQLFGCKYANVQPHSGSQANQAVLLALLQPGDTILGLSLDSGGHLTHGARPNLSGKWFNSVHYPVDKETFLVDMNQVEELAKKHRPKLIIAGASAYPRKLDFKKFKEIAGSVGAYLLADVAHYSGLIVSNCYPSPFPYADIVTSTTHKTLRGPRGGVIMSNSEKLIKKINSAIFPGLQGGAMMHAVAAKATAFLEALSSDFKEYSRNSVQNAQILASTLIEEGLDILTGGTDCHMVLVDLRGSGIKGNDAANRLEESGIVCNKNTIPYDETNPFITSGLRFGTSFETTRGFKSDHFRIIANLIASSVLNRNNVEQINAQVIELLNSLYATAV